MAYFLGVDLGTTYTAAAVWHEHRVEVANLGNRAPVIPSLILLREDEELLTGEAADRRGVSEPDRLAREFKRRLGDPTPIIIGGTPYSAASLMGRLLRWVVDKVAESEGGPPSGVAVSHPANWGPYKLDLLAQAIQVADLDGVTTLTEPEAAAIHYATQSRVADASVIGVYDLGGGTFDAAVLRKAGEGFEILGEPQGIERLGGVDFDEAVYQHVLRAIGDVTEELNPENASAVAAMARLRSECVEAKEALSSDTDATIPVILPTLQTEVRITRTEFEHLIRPALNDSITSVSRALRSAGIEPEDLTTVLLVGGSSRIPLVGQMVGTALGRPVAVDAHPKHGIALGSAIIAAQRGGAVDHPTTVEAAAEPLTTVGPSEAPPVAPPAPVAPAAAAAAAAAAAVIASAPGGPTLDPTVAAPTPAASTPPSEAPSATTPPRTSSERPPPAPGDTPMPPERAARKPPSGLLIVGAVAAILLIIGGFVLFGGGGDDEPAEVSPQGSTTVATNDDSTPDTTVGLAPTGPFVALIGADIESGRFRLDYAVANFTPDIDGGPDSLHMHFFLDTTEPANAGNNGNPPGVWEITDDPTSFLMTVGPADVGAATQICGVVATVDHNVFDPDSGTCVDLPT